MSAPELVLVLALALGLTPPAPVDLTVHDVPSRPVAPGLAMRNLHPAASGGAAASASAGTSSSAPSTGSAPNAAPARDEASPEIHYRFNVGYGTDNGRATGADAATGFRGDPQRTLLRTYLFGDATFGARGLPTPSLNSYFAAAYYYDFLGATADSPFTTVYDGAGDARALSIRSAYAEYDPAMRGGLPVWVRAGRQFRLGAGTAHFDGASLGYDDRQLEVSGFVGRRVALYVDERTGPLGGGAVRVNLGRALGVPLRVAAEVLTFEGDLYTDLTVQLASGRLSALASARLFDQSLSDAFVKARLALTRRTTIFTDLSQKLGVAPVYDYVSGGEAGGLKFFTLPDLVRSTRARLGAALDATSELEIMAYGAATAVYGTRADAGPDRTGFDASSVELGAFCDLRPGGGMSLLGGYRVRRAVRPPRDEQPRLDDPQSAGDISYQELLADARYSLGPRRLTVTASGFLRYSEMQTPLAHPFSDVRAGLRFDIDTWVESRLRLKATYEVADPSPQLSPDVDTLQSVRVIIETVF